MQSNTKGNWYCYKCTMHFATEKEYLEHQGLKTRPERVIYCNRCDSVFATHEQVKEHIRFYHKYRWLQ